MNDLHLFAGLGGGILGSLLCRHRIVCAVEIDPYCQSVLVQRQNDGYLPPFPIWNDIRTFDGRRWRDIADLVSGGFPCQNISSAGDRTGITGEKSSLWFEMLRVIREVQSQYVFVENSAGLIRRGLDVVLGGLSEVGYDAQWCVLGADDVGAPHIRKRCWILGRLNQEKVPHADRTRRKEPNQSESVPATVSLAGGVCEKGTCHVENSDSQYRRTLYQPQKHKPDQTIRPSRRQVEPELGGTADGFSRWLDSNQQWLAEWQNFYQETLASSWSGDWESEIPRVIQKCPHRADRIKGLGNAQVPLCAAVAWMMLKERFEEREDRS